MSVGEALHRKTVQGAGALSSRRSDTGSEDMDELAAAAAVLAVDIESDSDEELGQEAPGGAPVGDLLRRPALEPSRVDKENENGPPEQQRPGTDNHKVSMHLRMQSYTPRAPSFTRCWHPALTCPAGSRCRLLSQNCSSAPISCSPRASGGGGPFPRSAPPLR